MTAKAPNIMWFTTQAKPTQWRRFTWWLIIIFLLILFVISWWLQQLMTRTQPLSLWDLKSFTSSVIHSPSIQRTALTLINYIQQHKSIPSSQLLKLYDDWYEEYCNSSSQGWVTSLTWSQSHPWCELYPHRKLLLDYLWYREPKTYLILLQNSAEVRPNGWFYGSFIRVTLTSGLVQDIKVHDSYEVPFINSWVSLNLPERTNNYLWHTSATFIAGNKFGFTDRDGRVIASIYNKTYNTRIDGVVFMSTKTITALVPPLQDQLWRWQFLNASVDLIRGHTGSFKKELYLTTMSQYLLDNRISLLGQALSNYKQLHQQGMMQIYLPDASSKFRATLKQLWRITDLDPYHLYLRDINQSYSKIDTFVTKHVEVVDQDWLAVIDGYDTILDLSSLSPWDYQMQISYRLSIPSRYRRLMTNLEDQYWVALTDREHRILWLDGWFAYKSVIFAGTWIILHETTWEANNLSLFDAWGTQAATYHIASSWDIRTVSIRFSKTKN